MDKKVTKKADAFKYLESHVIDDDELEVTINHQIKSR